MQKLREGVHRDAVHRDVLRSPLQAKGKGLRKAVIRLARAANVSDAPKLEKATKHAHQMRIATLANCDNRHSYRPRYLID